MTQPNGDKPCKNANCVSGKPAYCFGLCQNCYMRESFRPRRKLRPIRRR